VSSDDLAGESLRARQRTRAVRHDTEARGDELPQAFERSTACFLSFVHCLFHHPSLHPEQSVTAPGRAVSG
jgi:hypothetical protein